MPEERQTAARLSDIYHDRSHTHYSFEFFPPKTADGEENLFKTITELKALSPDFVSITYGAGGSTRTNTVSWADRIKNTIGQRTVVHLTCLGHTRESLIKILDRLKELGIRNIMALRGDMPHDTSGFQPTDFKNASDLIRLVREQYGSYFCIGAAVYPEMHPEAVSKQSDLEFARLKQDLGADFFVSQLFFNNDDFFRFRDDAAKAGISLPIVAGIMPVTNYAQIKRFTAMCGASIPEDLQQKLEKCGDNTEAVTETGINHATEQCRGLYAQKADGIHFYTLNKSRATTEIVNRLKRS